MLASGKYYVGDLCYVLNDKNGFVWNDVLWSTGYMGIHSGGRGFFIYKKVHFFVSETAMGDGLYRDNEGREYGVDAGIIGCFPLGGLGESPVVDGGHLIEFDSDFDCSTCDDGVITIGHIEIKTLDAASLKQAEVNYE